MTRYGPTGHPIDPVVCINGLGASCGPTDCILDHQAPTRWDNVLANLQVEIEAAQPVTTQATIGVPFGQTWDRMVNLIQAGQIYRQRPILIIGVAKWAVVFGAANREDRAVLVQMVKDGQIVISEYLPDPNVAYMYSPPTEPG